ncbi:MAG: type III secretion system export apparatus subunit SctU [Parachlamydiaceae bacterium]|nr:type III secretion system export apparatus subunit SctU [Parachlamydiaceae bacterium]
MADKTEKATPKKLRDARKKGQVAKAQDLPSAFTFVVSIWLVMLFSHQWYSYLGNFLIGTFREVTNPNLSVAIVQYFYEAIIVIFMASLPIMLIVTVLGVAIQFLTVGPVFSFEVFKFDIKKFDPVQNLKAKFKLKTLVELLKSVIKISVACYIIYDVMYASLPVLIKAVSMPIAGALMIFNAFLMEVVIKVGLFFLIIAIADYIYQQRSFASEMKMEKFEVKQEYKNTEGDPHIKGKRKQIAQEIAYQEGPATTLKRAQAVVTNPTHLAIALAFDKEVDAAPYIVAMAKDMLAERMIKMAGEYNIPIVRNISLAHQLWEDGDIYEYIPEGTYEAIAEILRWLASLETENAYDYTEER